MREILIFPQMLRSARAYLNWNRKDLADRCGFSPQTVEYFENFKGQPLPKHRAKIISVLQENGIEFVNVEENGKLLVGIKSLIGAMLIDSEKLYEQLQDEYPHLLGLEKGGE